MICSRALCREHIVFWKRSRGLLQLHYGSWVEDHVYILIKHVYRDGRTFLGEGGIVYVHAVCDYVCSELKQKALSERVFMSNNYKSQRLKMRV